MKPGVYRDIQDLSDHFVPKFVIRECDYKLGYNKLDIYKDNT